MDVHSSYDIYHTRSLWFPRLACSSRYLVVNLLIPNSSPRFVPSVYVMCGGVEAGQGGVVVGFSPRIKGKIRIVAIVVRVWLLLVGGDGVTKELVDKEE